MAPIIIGDHVIVGTGNDLDAPGYLQSFDPETGKRQWILYTVPMNAGDPGRRDMAEPRGGAPRRRPAVGARRLRSRDAPVHLRHRQSDARLHAGRPRHGRRAVHLLARRGQRRHRQDGLVLPDVAARHARLGLGADADSDRRDDQRPAAQARLDRRRATATSSPSIASPASTSPAASSVAPRTGPAAWTRRAGRSSIPRRSRRSRRRSSAAAPRTGHRRRIRRTPASFTSRRTTACRFAT